MYTNIRKIIRKLTSRSLQRRMMLIFTIMLVIPVLLVSYFSYSSASKQLELKMQESTQASVNLLKTTINETVNAAMKNVQQLSQQLTSADIDAQTPEARELIELFMKEHPELEILTVGNEKGSLDEGSGSRQAAGLRSANQRMVQGGHAKCRQSYHRGSIRFRHYRQL